VFFAYVGFIGDQFFSLCTDSTYMPIRGDKGGSFFSDLRIFSGTHFIYKLMYYNLYHVSDFTKKLNVLNLYVMNLYYFSSN
jgi:hypothetical protein